MTRGSKKVERGNCYTIAGYYIIDNNVPEMLLCHGIVAGQGPLEGKQIGHAWIEVGDVVFDYSNGNRVVTRKERYYEIGKITRVKRYSKKEAARMMLLHKNFGPWDKSVETEWQKERRENARIN